MKKEDIRKRLFENIDHVDSNFKEQRLIESQLMEAEAVPFNFTGIKKPDNDTISYDYHFTVDGIEYVGSAYRKRNQHEDGQFEIGFGAADGEKREMPLGHLNTIIETVANITQDFIKREPNVKTIYITGAFDEKDGGEPNRNPFQKARRQKAYLRFIKNKFPQYEVKPGRFGDNEITIQVREESENEMGDMKKIFKELSAIPVEDRYLAGEYHEENIWSLSTDGVMAKNSDDEVYTSISKSYGQYDVDISNYTTGDEQSKSFRNFENMSNYIINYYNKLN